MEGGGQAPHIAVFPGIGMSHYIPFVELAKKLVDQHGFTVTLIAAAIGGYTKTEEKFLNNLPFGINSIALPPVEIPEEMFILNKLFITIVRSLPALRDALHELKATTRLVALVADVFCTDSFDVAKEVGVPCYIFFTSNLFLISLSLYLPAIYDVEPGLPDVLEVPGCVPLHRKDFPDGFKDTSTEFFKMFLHSMRRYSEAQGILVNTFRALEPAVAKYFSENETGFPPLYLVGPLLKTSETTSQEKAECLEWLDRQPESSVLHISFGSMAMLSHAQMAEMAHGLEMSGHRFLWTIRVPVDKASVEGIDSNNPVDYLPEGFLERTKDVGFFLPSWAPQVEILNHPSTVGFLTHCGWNSTIESILSGTAMIAWPIYAEQAMNAVFLEQDAKMALRAEKAEGGIVKREEIARVVKGLMEGEQGKLARENVSMLQKAAAETMTEEGDSYKALALVANKWQESVDAASIV